MNLTPRQTQILKAIIEEYMTTAEAVGSQVLEKKYSLGVSPATIRNEMAYLTDQGFLRQPHTSAGRIPTPVAIKFYVDNLMQEKRLSVAEEVSAREEVWDSRNNFDHLLRQSAAALAHRTRALTVAAVDGGDVHFSGIANILDMPEFFDIDVARTVLSLVDENRRLRELFFDRTYGQDPVHIVFGSDLDWPFFEPISIAFSRFSVGQSRQGTLGVIGPCRLNYPYVIPVLKYFSNLITNMTSSWN
jgi:heat-inducible transcriptional repressor